MIESITLRNFKSFGKQQTIPLEPITVLVGPNNSGKSNFMSVARFVSNILVSTVSTAVREEGETLFHRPHKEGDTCFIRWDRGETYFGFALSPDVAMPLKAERLYDQGLITERQENQILVEGRPIPTPASFNTDRFMFMQAGILDHDQTIAALNHWVPLAKSRTIKLAVAALRRDAEVVPKPEISLDGQGLAAVVGLWRGAMPEKVEALNGFLTRCLPEMKDVLVRPAPVPGHQRLWFRQKDGLEFDAEHVSDGVLAFTALAMHALSAEPGQLLCIEEPEQSIHPKRLRELVDLLKDIVRERGCQFIIATHSTVLLNVFRDEPEAILLFRRTDQGTRVKRLSDVPELVEALQKTPPGDLLETNAFSTAF